MLLKYLIILLVGLALHVKEAVAGDGDSPGRDWNDCTGKLVLLAVQIKGDVGALSKRDTRMKPSNQLIRYEDGVAMTLEQSMGAISKGLYHLMSEHLRSRFGRTDEEDIGLLMAVNRILSLLHSPDIASLQHPEYQSGLFVPEMQRIAAFLIGTLSEYWSYGEVPFQELPAELSPYLARGIFAARPANSIPYRKFFSWLKKEKEDRQIVTRGSRGDLTLSTYFLVREAFVAQFVRELSPFPEDFHQEVAELRDELLKTLREGLKTLDGKIVDLKGIAYSLSADPEFRAVATEHFLKVALPLFVNKTESERWNEPLLQSKYGVVVEDSRDFRSGRPEIFQERHLTIDIEPHLRLLTANDSPSKAVLQVLAATLKSNSRFARKLAMDRVERLVRDGVLQKLSQQELLQLTKVLDQAAIEKAGGHSVGAQQDKSEEADRLLRISLTLRSLAH